jgi:uncharacterized cupin superfamily protein
MGKRMKRGLVTIAILATGPALAAPGGPLDSLEPGRYVCEQPGDATGPAGLRQDDETFVVLNAGSYEALGGRGTYLVTGDVVTITSGPKNGQRFRRVTANFMRKLGADGKEGTLRCVRRVVNNS